MADTSAASALHAPPPSYGDAAPPLKGILKNAPRRSSSAAHPAPDDVLAGPAPEPCPPAATIPALHPSEPPPANAAEGAVPYRDSDGRLHWDESNLASNDYWKETTAPRMKVDEPKTPFVQGAVETDMDILPFDDDFVLDRPAASSAQPQPQPSVQLDPNPGSSPPSHATSRAAEAELTRLNTEANARVGHRRELSTERGSSDAGRSSRSPSFSLPNGQVAVAGRRRSSAGSSTAAGSGSGSGSGSGAGTGAAGPTIAALRAANGGGAGGSSSALSSEYEDDASSSEEDAPPMSVAEQRKHAAFAAKRKGHYGHEADALKYARALMAEEDEEEQDHNRDATTGGTGSRSGGSGGGGGGGGGGGLPPPVPPLPRAFQ